MLEGGYLGLFATALVAAPLGAPAQARDTTRLYVVVLDGPGVAAAANDAAGVLARYTALARQNRVLAAVDDEGSDVEVVARWSDALVGLAVRVTEDQADVLRAQPDVQLVEADSVRPLAGSRRAAAGAVPGGARTTGAARGGSGVVVGVVDTGIDVDAPSFAGVTAGPAPLDPDHCEDGPGWSASDCGGKVVAARWYVDGFGADAVASSAALSPLDTDGHGTLVASVAAGNAGVPASVAGTDLGRHGGRAPDASLAVYKACWSAPDPDDDGCSTTDLVSAVDDATADGVDVLSLSVGGPATVDALDLALLGAAESGVVVAAAAGDDRGTDDAGAAHPVPWVTTVGALAGTEPRGRLLLPDGPTLTGAMLSRGRVGPVRVVRGADVATTAARSSDARVCAPGSLDAAQVAGAAVLCERGRIGRVDKSRAVALADGAAMVLVNRARPGSRAGADVQADPHHVPTIHLDADDGVRFGRWLAEHPAARVVLAPSATPARRARPAPWSPTGSTRDGVVKPDLVAPASGLLGAVPDGSGWDFASGTAVAAAYVAGVAAVHLGRGDRPARVRSDLVTTTSAVPGAPVLRAGAGEVRPGRRSSLALLVSAGRFRAWYDGEVTRLDETSVVLRAGGASTTRRLTSTSDRRVTYTATVRGLRSDVRVRPDRLELAPGATARFRVSAPVPQRGGVDDGHVVWRGSDGTTLRLPVVVAR